VRTARWQHPLRGTSTSCCQVCDYHARINTISYSVPVYVVPRNERIGHVKLDTWGLDLRLPFGRVPMPQTGRAAAGSDQSMTVPRPSSQL
jgi:hypothetical protein